AWRRRSRGSGRSTGCWRRTRGWPGRAPRDRAMSGEPGAARPWRAIARPSSPCVPDAAIAAAVPSAVTDRRLRERDTTRTAARRHDHRLDVRIRTTPESRLVAPHRPGLLVEPERPARQRLADFQLGRADPDAHAGVDAVADLDARAADLLAVAEEGDALRDLRVGREREHDGGLGEARREHHRRRRGLAALEGEERGEQ